MEIIIISILFFCLSLCLVGFYRNNLIFKYRIRALKKTSKLANEAIQKKEDWQKYYIKLQEYDDYDKMFFNIFKWKYSDFYPDL